MQYKGLNFRINIRKRVDDGESSTKILAY